MARSRSSRADRHRCSRPCGRCARDRHPRAARARVGHGVRLRRLLRVRGRRRPTATSGCASTDRCSTRVPSVRADPGAPHRPRGGERACASAGSSSGIRSSTPRGRSTRSPRGARSATSCCAVPVRGVRVQDRHGRAAGGNPPPRLWELPAGLMNSIGLPNKGLDGYLAHDLPELVRLPVPLIVNVMGFTRDEVARLVRAFASRDEVAALELNVSCPNVETGPLMGADPGEVTALVDVRQAADRQAADRQADPERHRRRRGRPGRAGRRRRRRVADQHAARDGAGAWQRRAMAGGDHRRRLGTCRSRDRARPDLCGRSEVSVPVVGDGWRADRRRRGGDCWRSARRSWRSAPRAFAILRAAARIARSSDLARTSRSDLELSITRCEPLKAPAKDVHCRN